MGGCWTNYAKKRRLVREIQVKEIILSVSCWPFSSPTHPISAAAIGKIAAQVQGIGGDRRPNSIARFRHAGLRAGIHYKFAKVLSRLRPGEFRSVFLMDSDFRWNHGFWPFSETQERLFSVCYWEIASLEGILSDSMRLLERASRYPVFSIFKSFRRFKQNCLNTEISCSHNILFSIIDK